DYSCMIEHGRVWVF
nr:immunoglobulin light chain junction region [Macaca mulatta]